MGLAFVRFCVEAAALVAPLDTRKPLLDAIIATNGIHSPPTGARSAGRV
jgi:hypothetical protein